MSTQQRILETDKATHSTGISLAINQVSKTFINRGQQVEALRPVDLQVAPGEFVCLLGPSGCGKSTLLSIVSGLEPPSSGTILADGQAIHGPGTDRILLFQEAALFPWLDVQHNVEFGLRQKGISSNERAEIAQKF